MESEFRLAAFVFVFFVMAVWEHFKPRRENNQQRKQRWPINLGLMVLGAILVKIALGAIVYESALIAEEKNIGILNIFGLSSLFTGVLTIILLDLTIYGQHVLAHKLPLLWKLHQVHHTDLVYDTTTGVRFHPLEIFFSLGVKVVAVFIIGADPSVVILFEIILNTCAVFNHANVNLPLSIDKQLRKIVVTPDMHRVHHSVYRNETDSNYGFSISIWDRIFGTYNDQPKDGHINMKIGLEYARKNEDVNFKELILFPFKNTK